MNPIDLILPAPVQRAVRLLTNTRAFRPVMLIVRWAWLFYRELVKDKAFMRAAGMAYATLISLVPMLVLVFGVLGVVGQRRDSATTVAHALIDQVIGDVPTIRDALLPGLLEVDLGALGAVAVAGLLLTAGRLYLTVELAYCEIFGVPVRRTLVERILYFYFTITAIPVVIVTSVTATWEVAAGMGYNGALSLLAMGMTFGVLLAAMKSFPSVHVRWRPAIVGATVSFTLLEIGRKGFSLYVSMFVTDDPLRVFYGSLGLIPVFLLWMYLFWVFVLLGVEVTYVLQNYDTLVDAERDAAMRDGEHYPQVDDALYAAAWLAVAFQQGDGPMHFDTLAQRSGIDRPVLGPVLSVLAKARVVAQCEEGWLLARSPESLQLTELARAWRRSTRWPTTRPTVVHDELATEFCLDGTLADGALRWVPRDSPVAVPRPA
ncbi:MAG: membrane protein [Myxococcota bacterium]|jgi:membrane protein